MARVDTVISYGLYGISEKTALSDAINSFVPDPEMSAQVSAMVKKTAAISLFGASTDNWPDSSVCTATMLGFPCQPDSFEVSVEVDGSHIFGQKSTDRWTFMPSKDGLPGLMVPSNELSIVDDDQSLVEKTASSWAASGVGPEMVLSLAGLGIKMRLDDESTGLPSLRSLQQRQKSDDPSRTAGIMLKFASNQYPGMWLGEDASIAALTGLVNILEKIDPVITDLTQSALESFAE